MPFHRFGATCIEVSDPTATAPWDTTADIGAGPLGAYVPYVMGHLNLLQATPVGAAFFTAVTLLGKRIIVVYGGVNAVSCRGPGGPANKMFRRHKLDSDAAGMARELDQALQQEQVANAAHNLDWFCERLLITPLHRWDPSKTVHQSPLNQSGHAAGTPQFNALRNHLKGVVTSIRQGRLQLNDDDLLDLMILILADRFSNGAGGGSRVNYDPLKTGAGANARPPQIGLFHELVHAYYNAQGSQLSVEDSASESNGRYFELMAVGLPPFAGAPYSENTMRACFPPTQPRAKYEV